MWVTIDAQDLLLIFSEYGYNPNLWDPLATRIPPEPEGDAWPAAKVALVEGSDGMLAPIGADDLEILTGRGSHGTAALCTWRHKRPRCTAWLRCLSSNQAGQNNCKMG